MQVVISGIGLISPFGDLESTWHNIIAGKSAIRLHQPFPELRSLPLALIGKAPSNLATLTQLAVTSALQDAMLVPPLSDCAVVIGSSRGNQASWEYLARAFYSPDPDRSPPLDGGAGGDLPLQGGAGGLPLQRARRDLQFQPVLLENWLDTLPNFAACATKRLISPSTVAVETASTQTKAVETASTQTKSTCVDFLAPVLSPSAACASGIWALAAAFELIQTQRVSRALAGAIDAPITPLTLAGFLKMGVLSPEGCFPFDRLRTGFSLGEGGAVFLLESAQSALSRGASIYGSILGFGLTSDAYHSCALESSGKQAIAAINQCLQRSKLKASNIDYIHAHGTGTKSNDRLEAQIIKQLFGRGVAVSSTKGATGHTLGASGAIGAAMCLMSMKHQLLPPNIGLQQPEFDLDFVTSPRSAAVRGTLCLSFGFGGQNAAIAFVSPEEIPL